MMTIIISELLGKLHPLKHHRITNYGVSFQNECHTPELIDIQHFWPEFSKNSPNTKLKGTFTHVFKIN